MTNPPANRHSVYFIEVFPLSLHRSHTEEESCVPKQPRLRSLSNRYRRLHHRYCLDAGKQPIFSVFWRELFPPNYLVRNFLSDLSWRWKQTVHAWPHPTCSLPMLSKACNFTSVTEVIKTHKNILMYLYVILHEGRK